MYRKYSKTTKHPSFIYTHTHIKESGILKLFLFWFLLSLHSAQKTNILNFACTSSPRSSFPFRHVPFASRSALFCSYHCKWGKGCNEPAAACPSALEWCSVTRIDIPCHKPSCDTPQPRPVSFYTHSTLTTHATRTCAPTQLTGPSSVRWRQRGPTTHQLSSKYSTFILICILNCIDHFEGLPTWNIFGYWSPLPWG